MRARRVDVVDFVRVVVAAILIQVPRRAGVGIPLFERAPVVKLIERPILLVIA